MAFTVSNYGWPLVRKQKSCARSTLKHEPSIFLDRLKRTTWQLNRKADARGDRTLYLPNTECLPLHRMLDFFCTYVPLYVCTANIFYTLTPEYLDQTPRQIGLCTPKIHACWYRTKRFTWNWKYVLPSVSCYVGLVASLFILRSRLWYNIRLCDRIIAKTCRCHLDVIGSGSCEYLSS